MTLQVAGQTWPETGRFSAWVDPCGLLKAPRKLRGFRRAWLVLLPLKIPFLRGDTIGEKGSEDEDDGLLQQRDISYTQVRTANFRIWSGER